MSKTTKQEFEKYKKYCLEWQRMLGLDDWHLYFFHRKIKNDFANTAYDVSGRGATIQFNTVWDDRPVTDSELKECALHEVLHVLTGPLLNEARARWADEYSMDAEEHSIVTRLTNVLMRLT